MTLNEIYIDCENKGIEVYPFRFKSNVKGIALPDGSIAVDPDKIEDSKEELEVVAHEEAHIETGSFYNLFSPLDIKSKHERKAKTHTIKKLIPLDELKELLCCGITEHWELAEYFNVSDKFMCEALDYYKDYLMQ